MNKYKDGEISVEADEVMWKCATDNIPLRKNLWYELGKTLNRLRLGVGRSKNNLVRLWNFSRIF